MNLDPSSVGDFTMIGGNIEMDNAWLPELDLTFFATDHMAFEFGLANPSEISVIGTSLGVVDSSIGDFDLGKINIFPLHAVFQYHFAPDGPVRPYLGAGLNYTFFYAHETPTSVAADVSYNDNWGAIVQAGLDIPLGDNFIINFDVKRLWVRTDVQLRQVVALEGATIDASLGVNSWVWGAGFGWRF